MLSSASIRPTTVTFYLNFSCSLCRDCKISWSHINVSSTRYRRLPRLINGNESACNPRIMGLILGLGISSGERNGKPLQHSCLGNPLNRGAWRTIVHGVTKESTWLRDWTTHSTVPFFQGSAYSPISAYIWALFGVFSYSSHFTFCAELIFVICKKPVWQ